MTPSDQDVKTEKAATKEAWGSASLAWGPIAQAVATARHEGILEGTRAGIIEGMDRCARAEADRLEARR